MLVVSDDVSPSPLAPTAFELWNTSKEYILEMPHSLLAQISDVTFLAW